MQTEMKMQTGLPVQTGLPETGLHWSGVLRWVEDWDGGPLAYVALRSVGQTDGGITDGGITDGGIRQQVVAGRLAVETLAPGQAVDIEVDVRQAMWFEKRTGENLEMTRQD